MRKNVVLDFDGTIADSLDVAFDLYQSFFKKYNLLMHTPLQKEELRKKSLMELVREYNVSPFKLGLAITSFRKIIANNIDQVVIADQMDDFIKHLKSKDLNVFVMSSNTKKNIQIFLDKYLLRDCIQDIIIVKNIFARDKTILSLIDKIKCSKSDVIFIGDETRDIEAAKKACIPIISVSWGYSDHELLKKHEPDFLVKNIDELYKIFSINKSI